MNVFFESPLHVLVVWLCSCECVCVQKPVASHSAPEPSSSVPFQTAATLSFIYLFFSPSSFNRLSNTVSASAQAIPNWTLRLYVFHKIVHLNYIIPGFISREGWSKNNRELGGESLSGLSRLLPVLLWPSKQAFFYSYYFAIIFWFDIMTVNSVNNLWNK